MKQHIKLMIVLLALCTTTVQAQEHQPKNYIFTHIDYSFLGNGGDSNGSTIGINYIRMIYGRLGLYGGYSSSTGTSDHTFIHTESGRPTYTNVQERGDGEHAYNVSIYKSYDIGLTYSVTDGTKSMLLVSSGLNIVNSKHNYVSGDYPQDSDGNLTGRGLTFALNSDVEKGYFVALDYLYYFTGDVSLGFHAAFEDGEALSQLGVSLGYRF